MGSNNVIVVDAEGNRAGLEPTIEVGEGPTGLALDENRGLFYVLNRFEGSLSVIDILSETETERIALFDPTPSSIKVGRKHLYDTHKNSGLGHISCAGCHIDARMDRLAWDLGDPSGAMKSVNGNDHNLFPDDEDFEDFHPMKGPMTTQTLQDIIHHEPLHWRGDRDGLEEFNGAFIGLQAAENQLSPEEMQEYEDFLDTIAFPPNPNRNFDNSLPTDMPLPDHFTTGKFSPPGQPLPNGNADRGLNELYRDTGDPLDAPFACVTCHTVPTGMGIFLRVDLDNATVAPIPLGPNGENHLAIVSVDGSTNKAVKIPQLRNQFEKTGFNMTQLSNRAGFGYLHDGSVDSLERFVALEAFSTDSDQDVADLVALILSFSGSGYTPGNILVDPLDPPGPLSQDSHAAVGAQVTVTGGDPNQRLTDMIAVAEGGRADLIAKGYWGSEQRGAYYDRIVNHFLLDRSSEANLTPAGLQALASPGGEITFTLVPPGTGVRVGIDRDFDTHRDRTELDLGSDPADPDSRP
jgi:hypothetical protein